MKVATNAPAALEILWSEGFFFEAKELQQIKSQLQDKGYNFTDQNLAMAVRSSRFLTRKGSRGHFTYLQKHPYQSEEKA